MGGVAVNPWLVQAGIEYDNYYGTALHQKVAPRADKSSLQLLTVDGEWLTMTDRHTIIDVNLTSSDANKMRKALKTTAEMQDFIYHIFRIKNYSWIVETPTSAEYERICLKIHDFEYASREKAILSAAHNIPLILFRKSVSPKLVVWMQGCMKKAKADLEMESSCYLRRKTKVKKSGSASASAGAGGSGSESPSGSVSRSASAATGGSHNETPVLASYVPKKVDAPPDSGGKGKGKDVEDCYDVTQGRDPTWKHLVQTIDTSAMVFMTEDNADQLEKEAQDVEENDEEGEGRKRFKDSSPEAQSHHSSSPPPISLRQPEDTEDDYSASPPKRRATTSSTKSTPELAAPSPPRDEPSRNASPVGLPSTASAPLPIEEDDDFSVESPRAIRLALNKTTSPSDSPNRPSPPPPLPTPNIARSHSPASSPRSPPPPLRSSPAPEDPFASVDASTSKRQTRPPITFATSPSSSPPPDPFASISPSPEKPTTISNPFSLPTAGQRQPSSSPPPSNSRDETSIDSDNSSKYYQIPIVSQWAGQPPARQPQNRSSISSERRPRPIKTCPSGNSPAEKFSLSSDASQEEGDLEDEEVEEAEEEEEEEEVGKERLEEVTFVEGRRFPTLERQDLSPEKGLTSIVSSPSMTQDDEDSPQAKNSIALAARDSMSSIFASRHSHHTLPTSILPSPSPKQDLVFETPAESTDMDVEDDPVFSSPIKEKHSQRSQDRERKRLEEERDREESKKDLDDKVAREEQAKVDAIKALLTVEKTGDGVSTIKVVAEDVLVQTTSSRAKRAREVAVEEEVVIEVEPPAKRIAGLKTFEVFMSDWEGVWREVAPC